MLHHPPPLLQNRRRIPCAIYQIGKMVLQRLFIAGLVHVLEDFDHDARVPVCVEVDFLVVRDLADLAGGLVS